MQVEETIRIIGVCQKDPTSGIRWNNRLEVIGKSYCYYQDAFNSYYLAK